MSTTTAVSLISDFVTDLLSVLYGTIPYVLTGLAILIGIGISVRYVRKWIGSK